MWHDLPENRQKINKDTNFLVHRGKALIKELAVINMEIAQMIVAEEGANHLPDWFLVEIVRDIPRLIEKGR